MAVATDTDRRGNGVGTQAARISELLSSDSFQSVSEVYDTLVREFPTTTVGRVRQHCRWLPENHPGRLPESRDGRLVSNRLA
jgi:hypothetical protein